MQDNQVPAQVPIGTSVDYIDYNESETLKEVINNLINDLATKTSEISEIKDAEQNKTNQISTINEDIQQLTTDMSNIKNYIEGQMEDRIQSIVDAKFANKKISSDNISWDSGHRGGSTHTLTLRGVLGDLLNFPGTIHVDTSGTDENSDQLSEQSQTAEVNISTLRDWIQSVEARLENIENRLNIENINNLDFVSIINNVM